MKHLLFILIISTFFVVACDEVDLGERSKTGADTIIKDFASVQGKEFQSSSKDKPHFMVVTQVSSPNNSLVITTFYLDPISKRRTPEIQKQFNCGTEICVSSVKEQGIFEHYIDFSDDNLDEIILIKRNSTTDQDDSSTTYYLI